MFIKFTLIIGKTFSCVFIFNICSWSIFLMRKRLKFILPETKIEIYFSSYIRLRFLRTYMIVNVISRLIITQTPTITPAMVSGVHPWLQKSEFKILLFKVILFAFSYMGTVSNFFKTNCSMAEIQLIRYKTRNN